MATKREVAMMIAGLSVMSGGSNIIEESLPRAYKTRDSALPQTEDEKDVAIKKAQEKRARKAAKKKRDAERSRRYSYKEQEG